MNKNKKGVELTLQTIVVFIILLIVLIVVISFFSENYSSNLNVLNATGQQAIENFN